MSLKPDDRVLVKPLGVRGTVVRPVQRLVQGQRGRYVVRADCSTQDVVWFESELEKL